MEPKLPTVERRRHARRATDAPPMAHNWLVALIARNPALTGMTLALLLASVALGLVISAQAGLRDQTTKLRHFQEQTQTTRKANSAAFCKSINNNAILLNRQTDYLKLIILSGAQQSKAFEPILRKLGFPSYARRLAQAKKQAAGLERRKVPLLDCAKFLRQLEREGRP